MSKTTEIFNEKVMRDIILDLMHKKKVSYKELEDRFKDNGYPISQNVIRTYITGRRLSVDFLYVLTRVLDVTLDWIVEKAKKLSNEKGNLFDTEEIEESILKNCFQNSKYNFYFPCPISDNFKLTQATWEVSNLEVTLTVPAPDNSDAIYNEKKYIGTLNCTRGCKRIFVLLRDIPNDSYYGDPFFVLFNFDLELNSSFNSIVGFAIQIRTYSEGDNQKRAPIMHRFFLTSGELQTENEEKVEKLLDLRHELDAELYNKYESEKVSEGDDENRILYTLLKELDRNVLKEICKPFKESENKN